MSEPMDKREEVELPALEDDEGYFNDRERLEHVVEQRETQLKDAIVANREKDAEIAELIRKNRELAVLVDDLGKLVDKACDAGEAREAELASLRASGGEKPEDAWKRGWDPSTLTRKKERLRRMQSERDVRVHIDDSAANDSRTVKLPRDC